MDGGPRHQRGATSTSSRYTILGRLASGGMADIYLVRAVTGGGVDRHLVLKRVHDARSADPTFARMFLDEARLSALLQHPNIAQVYDVGTLDGAYFYTMEYVHGEDVRRILRRCGKRKERLPENLCLYIAGGILAALHHAHERRDADGDPLGVVHRDVSPSNIMVSFEGAVKLLDFGVAKASQRVSESRAGTIKGKVSYLSPEQCRGTTVDRRSDIFALGIVLYEMLTGKRLYDRDTDFNTMLAITNEPAPPPSERCPGLSQEIDRIVLTALQKDPAKRYASAAAMLEDIEMVAATERHLLTATAMARLMVQLFGTKREPWLELESQWDAHSTTGVVSDVDDHALDFAADDIPALQTQLMRAPDLRVQGRSLRHSEPIEAVSESGSGAGSEPSSSETPIPTLPPAPVQRSWGGVFAFAVLAVIAAGAVAYDKFRPFDDPASQVVASVAPTPAAAPDATPGVVSDATPAETAVATVYVDGSASFATDAGVSTPPVAATDASAPTEPARQTIAAEASTGNWKEVHQLCAAADLETLHAEDAKHCGVAACKRKQRATALDYYERARPADKRAIYVACKEQRIKLPRPRSSPQSSRPDPCSDREYVTAHPLECR